MGSIAPTASRKCCVGTTRSPIMYGLDVLALIMHAGGRAAAVSDPAPERRIMNLHVTANPQRSLEDL